MGISLNPNGDFDTPKRKDRERKPTLQQIIGGLCLAAIAAAGTILLGRQVKITPDALHLHAAWLDLLQWLQASQGWQSPEEYAAVCAEILSGCGGACAANRLLHSAPAGAGRTG